MKTMFLATFFISLALLSCLAISITASPSIPAVFAFGDSTVDPGNNNGLTTIFRGDHPPYGRDFQTHIPSGRFSNGKLSTDYLVSNLGIKDFLPAYLDASVTDAALTSGVSFASGGSGLDEATATLNGVLSMEAQLNYFDEAMRRIEMSFGKNRSEELVRKALFVVSVGTNDVVFNLYGVIPSAFQRSASSYHDLLIQRLGSFIQSLYDRGARKFGVAGLPPVGCLPLQISIGSFMPSAHMLQRFCVDQQNVDSQAYNLKLQRLLSTLQYSLPDSRMVYFGIYDTMIDMITNPFKYGFQETFQGCCGTGLFEIGPLCVVGMPTCPDASKYIFWDSMHPTQAAYLAISNQYAQSVLHLN
ncbi:GDSL esterase/lipase At2g40250-like [Humulus lupulus]|uniref:GDSL esterase/lipase At2g40250-like n=1 Tax=Humulus lupulus TaxID=3486 RepID=UPI002B412B33|nr:GDSL esterase/lipase At2g40250-like [Humulus lupulus]